jgi:hypothetical protein
VQDCVPEGVRNVYEHRSSSGDVFDSERRGDDARAVCGGVEVSWVSGESGGV